MSRYFNDDEISLGKDKTEPCRHDPTLVCQIDGVRFYAASISRVRPDAPVGIKADLYINLTGCSLYEKRNSILKAGGRWAPLRKYFQPDHVEEIVLDWPDMGIIPVGPGFWREFLSLIKKAGKKIVVVFCVGGHGRTGTFLASLMTVNRGIHGGKAIRTIRDGYCKRAVESKAQENYVRSLTPPAAKDEASAPRRDAGGSKLEKKRGEFK